jgi:hypothetical protein
MAPVTARQRCVACYKYLMRTGTERPKRLCDNQEELNYRKFNRQLEKRRMGEVPRTVLVAPLSQDRNELTTVYRFYDKAGSLMYVGITNNGLSRFQNHSRKEWWSRVATIKVEHWPTRQKALIREAFFIAKLKPELNLREPWAKLMSVMPEPRNP